jgi:hypothetical protein
LKKRSARQSGPSLWRPRKNPRLERSFAIVETFLGVRDATPNLLVASSIFGPVITGAGSMFLDEG